MFVQNSPLIVNRLRQCSRLFRFCLYIISNEVFKYRTWFILFFFFIFLSLSLSNAWNSQMSTGTKTTVNITFKICTSFAVISFYNFFSISSFHFVSLLFWIKFENCCLYTNSVLVFNLIQLFLDKTVIIYVHWDVIEASMQANISINVSVHEFVVGGWIIHLYGFLTTTHFGRKCDKWAEYYKRLNGNTFQRLKIYILWMPLKK